MAASGDDISSASLINIVTEKSDALEIDDSNVIDLPTANDSQVFAALINCSTKTYEVGDLLISYLEQVGIEYVFGIPGGPIEPLYNALARSEKYGGVKSVVARHETGAAFMADGYARNSGKIGVCCGTAGPGTTNLITGVSSAFDNHSPLLVITAQTALDNFGHGATQESGDTGINTVAMFSHCTRYSTLVSHVDQFEQKIASALMTACRSPRGPAHLSIPLDVLRSKAPASMPSYDLSNLLWQPVPVDTPSIDILCRELSDSNNIVFIIGEDCSEAIGNILNVAIALNARIVTTPHAKGLVSPYHPLFKGVIGFAGHKSATDVLNDDGVDLFLKIGTPLRETATCGWDLSVLNNKLIHVDSSEDNLMHSPMANLHVRGDLSQIFEQIENRFDVPQCVIANRELKKEKQKPLERHFQLDEENKCFDDSQLLKPQRLMTVLPEIFPPDTKYLCDSGNSMAWSIHYLHPYDRRVAGSRDEHGGLFWTCLEFGSMGWAIGSSIGTSLANKDRPVVCLTGDGAMLMFGGEVTVALQEKLPVFFIILNDSEYGMVKHGQAIGAGEPIGYELPKIDFVKYADSMGITSRLIKSVEDLKNLNIKDLMADGPVVLDVRIDKEEVPPINSRLKALGTLK
ncbi:MAG: thiamine pyrophosphate-binding protein [Gammaproteobacteria bacterium]|nr:thiamine pyrophosphate-binding protein [Gammaproteobacteria bacterium]